MYDPESDEGAVDGFDPESDYKQVMSPFDFGSNRSETKILSDRDHHLPTISEGAEFIDDTSRIQHEEFQDLQTRFRRQTTESFISSLSALAPSADTPALKLDASQLVEIGMLFADMSSKKTKMNVRKLLTEVNETGAKYDETYR